MNVYFSTKISPLLIQSPATYPHLSPPPHLMIKANNLNLFPFQNLTRRQPHPVIEIFAPKIQYFIDQKRRLQMDSEPLETLYLVRFRRQPSFRLKSSHSSCLDLMAFLCEFESTRSPLASWIGKFVRKFGLLQRQLLSQIRIIQILAPSPFSSNFANFKPVA